MRPECCCAKRRQDACYFGFSGGPVTHPTLLAQACIWTQTARLLDQFVTLGGWGGDASWRLLWVRGVRLWACAQRACVCACMRACVRCTTADLIMRERMHRQCTTWHVAPKELRESSARINSSSRPGAGRVRRPSTGPRCSLRLHINGVWCACPLDAKHQGRWVFPGTLEFGITSAGAPVP